RDLAGRTACGGCHVDVEVLVALEVRLDREPLSVRRELRLQDRLIGAQEGLLSLRPDVQDENGPLLALVRRVSEASSVGRHIEASQLPDFLQEPLGRERDLATHDTPSVGKVGGDKKPSRSKSSQEACCRTSRPFPSRWALVRFWSTNEGSSSSEKPTALRRGSGRSRPDMSSDTSRSCSPWSGRSKRKRTSSVGPARSSRSETASRKPRTTRSSSFVWRTSPADPSRTMTR